ncbi:Nitrous-oxide reductase [Aliiroseovarius sp. xm-m-379]|uniref:Sec-dependent nitrous-oxide reductase n=1 Tax=unclassified Aliiroseovarius TaxID=2623558 RepID=UPI001A079AC3|nr:MULTISPECIES: Sec-dependent nitrous-oxide reductase [unclassified Aliiroseovarius]NRP25943.1 Nitrous-oxide reductase [Aliiroseovarius sp. xm-m-379]NRP30310.1 Nitrous-oxide reductase [Aliiroseovarius sp. xm-m-314]NRP34742.1 Nitrous-oxide reductase [Aliiroseovarius sp. xm-a-104]NRP42978.1 Nitrous-oxide reductase [Aliiroseovarius sp. xm-m-378]NRP49868.1 Nitrous-oxide reductase [Aliiroseovarius sp. xm-m-354]
MISNIRKRFGATASVVTLGLAMGTNAVTAESLDEVMERRGLSQKDLLAAAKTYTPTGGRDEFIVFSSGGQSGQVMVYGVPSMRILKYVSVFTPEPWQGYGFDEESKAILEAGKVDGREIHWGDTHHPAITETNGDVDGEYLFINDKSAPRVGVISLHDFETQQIVVNPILQSEHGGTFVTPNSEYVIEAAQYPGVLGRGFAPLSEFNEKFRGAVTYWKFDREAGRIDEGKSFSIELPPYSQDLSDAGKGVSDGWSFTNSFCAERYVGGIESGRPPFEAGCSQADTDYLHIINWKKAEEVYKSGNVTMINDHPVISMQTAIDEGLVFLVAEPKSPHGVDVSPDGKYIIVGGKLDTQGSVYSFEKIKAAIDAKKFSGTDPYGIPVIAMEDAIHVQVPLGLGPLHTQYDSKECVVYTSLYVDSQVAKWDYCEGKVLDKISIHYNIGHLVAMEGETVNPKGKYLISLNKLAIDRFNPVGPLHPQNHQLIDISGDKMELLYDMPVPLGEPHYATAISAEKLKPLVRYRYGTNSRTGGKHEGAVRPGQERIERDGTNVKVYMTAIRSHFTPEIIEVNEGDTVEFIITNSERAEDETHGFSVSTFDVNLSLEPGKTATAKIHADRPGVFSFYCTEFCSALHLEMQGYLVVKPEGFVEENAELTEGTTYGQADYDKQFAVNMETQAVIDSVVAYITGRNFKDFPEVVSLVEDATDQLGFAAEAQAKAEELAKAEDWQNATLWAGQWWQYQVKAADIGLRAKNFLDENGAVKVE